ncbi:hypothetical protein EZL74_10990 [Flavobacterium silvisoli]|uniref:Glycosyltransferase RgtA/B/C/D-like domain-containing protein n=1 Tax=Flavobacterium silvisoli TaxID=2529433 RepID=A0A4Q9YSI3_9FLAO|nr:hypothetical protein [Flavobacterium silvisoli]TBX66367.1 hypothetical protein EZL74_10990 [Flavobacterium silvisoli]
MKKSTFTIVLFFYHLVFVLISYQYYVTKGGDAPLYWHTTNYSHHKSWVYFLNYGTDFILFLNYPFIKLGLPLWFGFLLYGCIGFFGILKWMQWAEQVLGSPVSYKGINILWVVLLFPSLHFWTAALGKEPLVFWGIASVFYALTIQKYNTFSFIAGSLLLIVIRPHVALMLLLAAVLIFVFQKKYSLRFRLILATAAVSVFGALCYMVLQITKIRYLDWNRIRYYNEYSILSFKNSGGYVPMLDYTYFYRLFSFNFRPLFFEVQSVFGFFSAAENTLLLLLYGLALLIVIRYYPKIAFPAWMQITFLFVLIASLLYIQRYANFGIFMRTKIMYQPFAVIALFCIIKQGLSLRKTTT